MTRAALHLIADAPAHGLDTRRYRADVLAQWFADGPVNPTCFARALDAALVLYLSDLHAGSATAGFRQPASAAVTFDPARQLASVHDARSLAGVAAAAAPAIPLYNRVKAALAQYRALAHKTPQWPPMQPAGKPGIRVGEIYAGVKMLQERLQQLGDLDADATTDPSNMYSPVLAQAVRRFQRRHGLTDDGILGAGTIAALAVTPAHRAAQLALTLERLRWLPPLPAQGRLIAVNVPTYRLWAFNSRDGFTTPELEMRVIVGAGGRTPTPLFIGQMRSVEFDPYWNVPSSIQKGEIVPKLMHNGAYLQQNDMELVGADGRVLHVGAAEAIARLRTGPARIRQRPGPQNVLGDVKFAMPNPMNIYLHSTSAKELFQRTRRDLSHGCIRVEQPAALAQFVLADPQRWDAASVAAAMQAGVNRTVTLPEPVPVVLFYATALVDRQGQVLFAQDIYARDQPLIAALHLE